MAAETRESLQQAADWFALLQSGRVTDAERADWNRWLAANPEHRHAWARVEAINLQFNLPDDVRAVAEKTLTEANRSEPRRRRAIKTLLGIGGAGVIGWAVSRDDTVREVMASINADQRTAVGETREMRLEGGPRVVLNTDTALDVEFRDDSRVLQLRRGEVLVDTEAAQPVVVETPQGRLRAQGTRFAVRRWSTDESQLSVFAGRVEVHPGQASRIARVIDAGEQVRFNRAEVGVIQPVQLAREFWTRGILLAENVLLSEFLSELGRYRRGILNCDPAVASLRVVGGYPLRQPERVLDMLAAALPIQVHRRFPWWTTIGPR